MDDSRPLPPAEVWDRNGDYWLRSPNGLYARNPLELRPLSGIQGPRYATAPLDPANYRGGPRLD